MLEFVWPWIFLVLPLPLFVYAFTPSLPNTSNAIATPFFESLKPFDRHGIGLSRSDRLRYLCLGLSWLMLVTAAAKPEWLGEPIVQTQEARNIMLAVDVSQSMETPDMFVNGNNVDRLTMVKSVLKPFIEKREGDRIGLILFGTQAYLQAPLTQDVKTVQTFLDEGQIGIAGPKTAIGDAIGLALKRLMTLKAKERVLVLLTDGQSNVGLDPQKAAELAATQNLKIFTVGVGASEMAVSDLFGRRNVNPSQDLEQGEKALQKVAELTAGKYFRARSTKELESIYNELDKIELTRGQEQFFRPKRSLFFWPLTAALLLLVGAIFFERLRLFVTSRTQKFFQNAVLEESP